ncbi:hypothetical protein [Microbacterium sp. NPDC057650]|uniref:hypothetical protein n=1 Tax=unclassified Microbacterium TaxID=2609290 RepID=UPI003670A5B9
MFFDVLKLRWDYEPEGYVIHGTPYLPDFKLLHPNDESTFVEVKGDDVDMFEGEHVRLARGLADQTGSPVILLSGIPALRLFNCVAPGLDEGSFRAVFFDDYTPKRYQIADEYWFQQTELCEDTGAQHFGVHMRTERAARKSFGLGVLNAIASARAAQFEHGESPTEVNLPKRD